MNKYLLDTNVVSELRKPRPHGGVIDWLSKLEDDQLFLSAVTLGELQAGIERTRRQDSAKASEIEAWADQLATSYQILAMDTPCFREWGRIMDRRPDQLLEDAMIAATARVHQLIVATRNEADFKQLGVRILNPFRALQYCPIRMSHKAIVSRMAAQTRKGDRPQLPRTTYRQPPLGNS